MRILKTTQPKCVLFPYSLTAQKQVALYPLQFTLSHHTEALLKTLAYTSQYLKQHQKDLQNFIF